MRTALALASSLVFLMAVAPDVAAQAAYYNYGEDGIALGYQHAETRYVDVDAVAVTYVGKGTYEIGVAYSWEYWVDVLSVGLGTYPFKQGRNGMPVSLGVGLQANMAMVDAWNDDTIDFSGLPFLLQAYQLDLNSGPLFLVQTAQLSYPIFNESGVSRVWAGTVGLELLVAPRRDFFLGLGYLVTFTKGDNPQGVSLTLSIPLSKPGEGGKSFDW